MEDVWSYRSLLLQGTLTTILLALGSLAIAVVFGLLGAWGKLGRSRAGQRIAGTYVTVVRSIPDLCMMLLLYYGGQTLLNQLGAATGLWDYIEINQFVAGILTIGFIFGAYMTETFRGAYQAIPKGQFEAAVAIGMTQRQTFRRITLPQLLGYAIPSLGVNWMVLLKTTALVSIIGLQDVVWYALSAGRTTRNPFAFFLAVMAIYLVLTFVSEVVLRLLERRYTTGRMVTR
ncbi:MAG: ABC transporter permease subunit [Pseudomonadota bacterium]